MVDVVPGSLLHVFSDGVFEIEDAAGRLCGLDDFTPLLLAPPDPVLTEPERLFREARCRARPGPPEDDVSLLTVTFLS
jgi:serine phosphatase RsbU (regulator of sigma subunit)